MMKLKLYKKEGDLVRVSFFQFIDLAGSERMGKTGTQLNEHHGIEGCMTNVSLLSISKCVNALSLLKKPLTGGEKIPPSIPYKEFLTTKVFMRPMFNGLSYAIFNFCISQHEANSGETWCSMEFANKVKELVSVIKQQPAVKITQAIGELEEKIK